jgi:hypothetical protein
MGSGGWRAVVVGDPVGNGRGDSTIVSPTDDKVVVIVGGGVTHGNIVGAERWTT